MSEMRLKEFVKAVRGCKTAAEERAVVQKESALIRNVFKEDDTESRARNVSKLLFINLLNYPTSFGQIECLKLIASNKFTDKRFGYLGLVIIFSEEVDVLMMATNSIRQDLNVPHNPYIESLALSVIGELATAEMCRELYPEIKKLMMSSNALVRRKASFAAVRVIRKLPDMVEEFIKIIDGLILEKSNSLFMAGVVLMKEIMMANKDYIQKFRKHVGLLIKALNVLSSGTNQSSEHDLNGIRDPFCQVQIMKVLALIGKGNVEASEEMMDTLTNICSHTESKVTGNSILYECVKTILTIEANSSLINLATSILGKFLSTKENNLRYVALTLFQKVALTDPSFVQRHRSTIIECIKDIDGSIRKTALALIQTITNSVNIKKIVGDLLEIIKVECEYKDEIAKAISQAVDQFCTSVVWHFDTFIEVLSIVSSAVPDELINNLIHIIIDSSELQGYAAEKSYLTIRKIKNMEGLSILAFYIIGEYGNLIDFEKIGENKNEIITTYKEILFSQKASNKVKLFGCNSLIKLCARLNLNKDQVKEIFNHKSLHCTIELQQRCIEYLEVLDNKWDELRKKIFKLIPLSDKITSIIKSKNLSKEGENGSSIKKDSKKDLDKDISKEPSKKDDIFDLLNLDNKKDEDANKGAVQGNPISLLEDVFANISNLPAQAPIVPQSEPISLLDIQSLNPPNIPNQQLGISVNQAPTKVQEPSALMDLLNTNLFAEAKPNPPIQASNLSTEIIEAYRDTSMVINMICSKVNGDKAENDIQCEFKNLNGEKIESINLQVAVQKYLKLQMFPSSGTTLSNTKDLITQKMKVTNTIPDEKPVVLKIKINYTKAGEIKSETKIITFK